MNWIFRVPIHFYFLLLLLLRIVIYSRFGGVKSIGLRFQVAWLTYISNSVDWFQIFYSSISDLPLCYSLINSTRIKDVQELTCTPVAGLYDAIYIHIYNVLYILYYIILYIIEKSLDPKPKPPTHPRVPICEISFAWLMCMAPIKWYRMGLVL